MNNMRKVLIYCIILFLILSVIPLCSMLSFKFSPTQPANTDKNVTVADKKDIDKLIKTAAALCDEDFCDEGLKCALVIAKNNMSISDITSATEQEKFPDGFYERLFELYEETTANLKYKGKAVFIPTASLSIGFTQEHPDYPYMKSVASPWDCTHKDFVYGKEYARGISMAGLNYLCENGMSYTEALKWYLPEFNIK